MKHLQISILAVAFFFLGCTRCSQQAKDSSQFTAASSPVSLSSKLEQYTLPGLPEWTVAFSDPGDIRFFDLEKLMTDFEITRYQAAEVQNGYRDLTRDYGTNPIPAAEKEKLFEQALEKVKKEGSFENSLDQKKLAAAEFIVAFDLDNTLYDQHAKELGACADIQFESKITKKKIEIKLAPGWEDLIRYIHKAGGTTVFFSAWLDPLVYENLEHWLLDGKPILKSDKVAGLLAHSHLSMGRREKDYDPRSIRSKDLRIIDPTLSKVILVDNNPTLVFQFRHVRVVPPFHGEALCKPIDEAQSAVYESSLASVRRDIDDSIEYLKRHPDMDFSAAFLPFTELGKLTFEQLSNRSGWTAERARNKIRQVPTIVPAHY